MCESTPTKNRRWAQFFLVAELCAVASLLYGAALWIMWRYDAGGHPHIIVAYGVLSQMLMPVLCCFITACVFLMLASPFFLSSLRSVAVKAWTIGVAALFYAGLLFVLR